MGQAFPLCRLAARHVSNSIGAGGGRAGDCGGISHFLWASLLRAPLSPQARRNLWNCQNRFFSYLSGSRIQREEGKRHLPARVNARDVLMFSRLLIGAASGWHIGETGGRMVRMHFVLLHTAAWTDGLRRTAAVQQGEKHAVAASVSFCG